MTRRTRLEVAPLEDRLTPVAGGYDVPFAADTDDPIKTGSADLTGVVSYNGTGTGALLDRGAIVVGSRQIVTAAHSAPAVGDLVTFYHRLPDGNLEQIQIPVAAVWVEPSYIAAGSNPLNNVGDVALVTLAAIAPFGVTDYPIYTAAEAAVTSEVGKPYIVAGFGRTGTGTSGASVAQELQRMTVTATSGSYQIVRPDTGMASTTLAWNATAPQIAAAFASIGLPAQVTQVTVGPFSPVAGVPVVNFEVRFNAAVNLPRMTFVSNPGANTLVNGGNLGRVDFTTLVNGAIDPELQRLTVTATAGSFRLGFGGATGTLFTTPIAFNATAAQIQTALQAINSVGEVTVRRVPAGALNAGSFQVSFDNIGFKIPLLIADTTALTGTVSVAAIMDGGQAALRVGANEYDAVVQGTLTSDFDPDGTDEFPQVGDDGAPGFFDTGSGRLAIASIASYGGGGFGATENDTRVSKYATNILNEAAAIRPNSSGVLTQMQDTIALDMSYQFVGNDGVADTITINQVTIGGTPVVQIWVQSTGGTAQLYYQDLIAGISSIKLTGSADDERFVIDSSLTKLVSIDGGSGTDTLVGPDSAIVWSFPLTAPFLPAGQSPGDTAFGDGAAADVTFANVENLIGGAAADTFRFAAGGSLSGTLDGGGGTDTLDFAALTGTTALFTGSGTTDGFRGAVVTVAGGFDNINGFAGNPNAGSDEIITPDTTGVFTHTGAGGVYTDTATGRTLAYVDADVLTGGSGNDTFNVLATTAPLAINGGAGDDVVTVSGNAPATTADGALGGALTFTGGAGNDFIRVNGTAADEFVTASVSSPNTATVQVLNQTVSLIDAERFLFDGRGGANSFTALDTSNA